MDSDIKILLIEDNQGDARLIQEMLLESMEMSSSETTFQLIAVETLAEGLKELENEFHVVLLDLSLPDSHGLQTFKKVYNKIPQIPVIVLSGLDDKNVAKQAVHDGAQDYLVKGHVDRHLLSRAIQYAIERKQAEIENADIQRQLFQAQKMEAIGILAGGVAHDFNNLMTAIQGFSDVLMMKTDESKPEYKALKQIRMAASSASDLTRQMLFFSRKQTMIFTNININRVIENLLKMLHRITGEDIDISLFLNPNISIIHADRGTVEQVIMNLAINAKEAMPDGGRLTIKTKNETLDRNFCKQFTEATPGKYIHITVADTGIGMDQKILEHIFEPFYSTKGRHRGGGLGLSVVYGIIQQHKGWLHVESKPSKGSVFHIYFPCIDAPDPDMVKETFEIEDYQGNGKKILLVEDSDGVREFASIALIENGYEVLTASTASEAVQIFHEQKNEIDLMISDVVLPDKSGIKLANELHVEKSDLPVLLSSGYSDEKINWTSIKKKTFSFLPKPYAFSDLLRTVKEMTQ